jgi:hypothetical protein
MDRALMVNILMTTGV